VAEDCWEGDRSRGPQRSPVRPQSRSGGCDAVGIGGRIAVMIVGTGAMIAGAGARSISDPIGRRSSGGGTDSSAVA
jgi:hypothetical protein